MKVCSILKVPRYYYTSFFCFFFSLGMFLMSLQPFICWHIFTTIATCVWTHIIIQTSILSITVAVCVLIGGGLAKYKVKYVSYEVLFSCHIIAESYFWMIRSHMEAHTAVHCNRYYLWKASCWCMIPSCIFAFIAYLSKELCGCSPSALWCYLSRDASQGVLLWWHSFPLQIRVMCLTSSSIAVRNMGFTFLTIIFFPSSI